MPRMYRIELILYPVVRVKEIQTSTEQVPSSGELKSDLHVK